MLSTGLPMYAQSFLDCFEARGWRLGKGGAGAVMKDWKAAARTFCRTQERWEAERK
jgi:hypothetical protein